MAHCNSKHPKKIGLYSQDFIKFIRSVNADSVVLAPTGVLAEDVGLDQTVQEESHKLTSTDSEREKKDSTRCLTCGVVFKTREDQVTHYQLDWHRYNLKRRLKGLRSLEQDQFEGITGESISCDYSVLESG